ncbi:DNA repair protein RecN [Flavobacteriaceae bacterium TK19130]|nr:DNA repair protein RecN [Thermobacterium salinum]
MITHLSIQNYALIDSVAVDFNPGLTIITGETGAGKSILLGALSLLLGKRADLDSVKDTSAKSIIEAHFDIDLYSLKDIFEANDLDYDSHTIIRREILPSGKSRAFVNDTPVTLNQLQAISEYLVDIHSQHEALSITSEDFQLEIVDTLAKNKQVLRDYQVTHNELKKASEALEALRSKRDEALKQQDYNAFLLSELEAIALEEIDEEALEEEQETLANAEEIQETLSAAFKLLSEENIGTLETAKESRNLLARVKDFSKKNEALWERLQSVIIEIDDVAAEMEQLAEETTSDPQRLQLVNEQLQQLHALTKKHIVGSVSELITLRDELRDKVSESHSMDEKLETLDKTVQTLYAEAEELADTLHKNRSSIIPKVIQRLEQILQSLGLPNAQLAFDLRKEKTLRSKGMDRLSVRFSANKGSAPGDIKKVASGGEMSRIMLAIKATLADYKTLPTLIFDEIDTGVSGEIAQKMAGIMENMTSGMQLMSITHLPQIASKGQQHIKVYKTDEASGTVTRLKVLSPEERITEIAQMIGGEQVSESAVAHARELLN